MTLPYSIRKSMVNGTVPVNLAGATPTSAVTPINTAREAERYWGHSHMDSVMNTPFGQTGTYVAGWHPGDKVEYLMEFGSVNENLHLIGISDKPGPVLMNIYIDGYYKRQMQWVENDNKRHLRVDKIPGITFGTHAIAIEFVNDQAGASGDLDRNFYIDVIGVNSGAINSTAVKFMFFNPFFDSTQSQYLPLVIK